MGFGVIDMQNPFIGSCPGCGQPNSVLRFTQYKALAENGTTEPICGACEERYITKLSHNIRKHTRMNDKEKEDALKALRSKIPIDATSEVKDSKQ